MPEPAFVELVARLTESFGQQMGSSRQIPEGILLQTTDGFLYAFIAEPERLSLATVQKLLAEAPGGPRHLVVFCRQRLPLAFTSEILSKSATLVEGSRFVELANSLGLGSYLGEEPRPERPVAARLLPSARHLDGLMARARTWQEWDVPALALRFYRQAVELKPEFLPARNGVAAALLRLGLIPEAERAYADVRTIEPENLEARLGQAAVLGAQGHPDGEIAAYRELLAEDAERTAVRAHLIAALLDHHHWSAARDEIALMLERVPEDARLRFLHGVALDRAGASREAEAEKTRARNLGLSFERERALSLQLGLGEPPARTEEPLAPTPADTPTTEVPRRASPPPSARPVPRGSATRKAGAASRPRSGARRKGRGSPSSGSRRSGRHK
ncbi:MAG TPA: hypothetical protein VGV89_04420 [Thermoplasmata archaeon]|nr:hypothetical protein [Thermoplasmata archaeon]